MAEAARLNVLIEAKAEQLEQELSKASQRLDRFGARMQSIGTKLTIGVTAPILAIGAATVKAANEAEESENLFEVSMGNMADSARAFSEQVADSLGRNAFAIRENIGSFNALFTTLGLGQDRAADMSQSLAQLTIDLASFFNTSESDAFRRLQSGLSGQIEPLRRFNVFLTEAVIAQTAYRNGIAETGAELTEAQKVQARYLAILEQTALAQGDAARTSDSATNQTRAFTERIQQLRIEIGQKLQPAYVALLRVGNRLVQGLSDLVSWFKELPAPVQTFLGVLTALAVAAGPVLLVVGGMAQGLAALAATGAAVAGAIGSAGLLGAVGALAGPLAIAGAAVVALTGFLVASRSAADDAKESFEDFRRSLSAPVTIDTVRDLNVAASLAAVKVAALRDEIDKATDPIEELGLRKELRAAEQELARLQRRADLVDRIPIETQATITAKIDVQKAELDRILAQIDKLEQDGGNVVVDVQTPNLTPIGSRLKETRQLSVSADNQLAVLNRQADKVAARINDLERDLETFRSKNKPIEVEIGSDIDPDLAAKIETITASVEKQLGSLKTQAAVLDLPQLEVAEERVDILRSGLIQLADEGLGPNARAVQTLAERLAVAEARMEGLADQAGRVQAFDPSNLIGSLAPDTAINQLPDVTGLPTIGANDDVKKGVEKTLLEAEAVARSFEGSFRQVGFGLVQAMATGVLDAGDLLLTAFSSILSGVIGTVFGNVGGLIGGLFSVAPEGGFVPGGGQAGNLSAIAADGVAAATPVTVMADFSGAVLFGDPASVARTPGAQIFVREARLTARDSGASY